MRAIAEAAVLYLLEIIFYAVVPALTIWGWARWLRRPRIWNFASISCLVAFALATASALLAVFSIVWAHEIGGFASYDRRLLMMYRCGFLLSSVGLLFSLAGLWKANPLRWHALACAIGNILFWFSAGMGE
jgi:hypothetical protein